MVSHSRVVSHLGIVSRETARTDVYMWRVMVATDE